MPKSILSTDASKLSAAERRFSAMEKTFAAVDQTIWYLFEGDLGAKDVQAQIISLLTDRKKKKNKLKNETDIYYYIKRILQVKINYLLRRSYGKDNEALHLNKALNKSYIDLKKFILGNKIQLRVYWLTTEERKLLKLSEEVDECFYFIYYRYIAGRKQPKIYDELLQLLILLKSKFMLSKPDDSILNPITLLHYQKELIRLRWSYDANELARLSLGSSVIRASFTVSLNKGKQASTQRRFSTEEDLTPKVPFFLEADAHESNDALSVNIDFSNNALSTNNTESTSVSTSTSTSALASSLSSSLFSEEVLTKEQRRNAFAKKAKSHRKLPVSDIKKVSNPDFVIKLLRRLKLDDLEAISAQGKIIYFVYTRDTRQWHIVAPTLINEKVEKTQKTLGPNEFSFFPGLSQIDQMAKQQPDFEKVRLLFSKSKDSWSSAIKRILPETLPPEKRLQLFIARYFCRKAPYTMAARLITNPVRHLDLYIDASIHDTALAIMIWVYYMNFSSCQRGNKKRFAKEPKALQIMQTKYRYLFLESFSPLELNLDNNGKKVISSSGQTNNSDGLIPKEQIYKLCNLINARLVSMDENKKTDLETINRATDIMIDINESFPMIPAVTAWCCMHKAKSSTYKGKNKSKALRSSASTSNNLNNQSSKNSYSSSWK